MHILQVAVLCAVFFGEGSILTDWYHIKRQPKAKK